MSELTVYTITCLCAGCYQNDSQQGWICPVLWKGLRKQCRDYNGMQVRRQVWLDMWKRISTVDFSVEQCDRAIGSLTMSAIEQVRSIGNEDCIDAACRLKAMYGSCGILNMSSARHVGGGVWRGARAQEEELCRRSNLYVALMKSRDQYPLHGKVLVHNDVVFLFQKGLTKLCLRKTQQSNKADSVHVASR